MCQIPSPKRHRNRKTCEPRNRKDGIPKWQNRQENRHPRHLISMPRFALHVVTFAKKQIRCIENLDF